jgi:hypothetical protein
MAMSVHAVYKESFKNFNNIHSFIQYSVWRQVQNLLQNDSYT